MEISLVLGIWSGFLGILVEGLLDLVDTLTTSEIWLLLQIQEER